MKIGGQSNSQGFRLCGEEGIEVKNKGFDWGQCEIIEFDSYPFIALFLAYGDDSQKLDEEKKKIQEQRMEWHAAEHMIINLLESGKPLTMKNLRESPMEGSNCSSDNKELKKPDKVKLLKALRMGKRYLRLYEKKFPSSSFFRTRIKDCGFEKRRQLFLKI